MVNIMFLVLLKLIWEALSNLYTLCQLDFTFSFTYGYNYTHTWGTPCAILKKNENIKEE